jgi:hypothetical protein
MNEQITRRRFALKYNLDQLKIANEQTKRDSFLDVGLEYGVKYEDNEWYHEKEKSYQILKREREYIFFTYIVNFTQCYYMIKEYINKLYPQYKDEVERFFSNPDNLNLPRKSISNDLKHKPQFDIEYDLKEVHRETTREGNKIVHKSYVKHSWFYKNLETVEYCTRLFDELENFIEDLLEKEGNQKST